MALIWHKYDCVPGHGLCCYDPITLTVLSVASTALAAGGTLMGGAAAADAGARGQQAQEFKAQQEEMAAQESRAGAQRAAMESRRKGTFLQSTLQARAAASGGGADDPTVLNLGGDIAARSEYDALFDMYKGENRARGLEDQAMASRLTGDALKAEGEAKRTASYLSADGTIIGGAGSAYRTYNRLPTYDPRTGYG